MSDANATANVTPSAVSPAPLVVGIDVAKDKLDLARSDADAVEVFASSPDGVGQILRLLRAAGPAMIVIESTGGLERRLVEALLEADLPVALVHPKRVR